MFEKFEREKVFRDPIYGYITVDYKIISDLIDTKEVQRLRRIRQLSGVSMVFHTAEHSRFAHSLGTYEMARRICESVSCINENMNEYEKLIFLISSLLHDIGHGPYSHAFEHVMSISHEAMSAKLILGNTQVNEVLSKYSNLANDVANVILHLGKYPLIEALTSSQLDVDRMDYLQRDAYFTGATYGTIDVNRLVRSMKIIDKQVIFRASGVHSIESYIMSRYHMYWQVYFHPTARAYELILQSIYTRLKDLVENNEEIDANISSFINVMKDNNDLDSYINLDDAYVNGMIKQLSFSKDKILSKLSNDFQNRKLFEYKEINVDSDLEKLEELRKKYLNDNLLSRYCYYESTVSQAAYLHVDQTKSFDINDIKIEKQDGSIVSLEDFSPIIKGLVSSGRKKSVRVFYGNI